MSEASRIISSFGDRGIGLGSQVPQLIQLAVLDELDHIIKERMGISHYVRYMDDFILIHESKSHLRRCEERIIRFLAEERKLCINERKTGSSRISQPIGFLGFRFKLHESGKVTWKLPKGNIAKERRKLRRLIKRVADGKMDERGFDDCYQSWRAHAKKSDSRGAIMKMDRYKEKLKWNTYQLRNR